MTENEIREQISSDAEFAWNLALRLTNGWSGVDAKATLAASILAALAAERRAQKSL